MFITVLKWTSVFWCTKYYVLHCLYCFWFIYSLGLLWAFFYFFCRIVILVISYLINAFLYLVHSHASRGRILSSCLFVFAVIKSFVPAFLPNIPNELALLSNHCTTLSNSEKALQKMIILTCFSSSNFFFFKKDVVLCTVSYFMIVVNFVLLR